MNESEIFEFLFSSPNLEQLKRNYIQLIKINHPDKGGSVEICQMINAIFDKLQRHPKFTKGYEQTKKAYQDENREPPKEDDYFVGKKTLEIISTLCVIDGLNLEICGSWLWISGNTYNYRQTLKELGCIFASKKKMWCFHESEWTRKNKHKLTIDEIRNLHGSQSIKQHNTYKLNKAV